MTRLGWSVCAGTSLVRQFSRDRLTRLPDGRLCYTLKHPFKDGSTHVLFTPLDLLSRLSALVPPPRAHLVVYDGVLAANASLRHQIVPTPPKPRPARSEQTEVSSTASDAPMPFPSGRRVAWAELGGRLAPIAIITDQQVIAKLLHAFGLEVDSGIQTRPRPPPEPAELHPDPPLHLEE